MGMERGFRTKTGSCRVPERKTRTGTGNLGLTSNETGIFWLSLRGFMYVVMTGLRHREIGYRVSSFFFGSGSVRGANSRVSPTHAIGRLLGHLKTGFEGREGVGHCDSRLEYIMFV